MNFSSFMQISNWEQSYRHFIYRVTILYLLVSGVLQFSISFFILYLYATHGIIEAGSYLLIVNLVKFSFDYLTGNLSDNIGQRGVMLLALLTHALAFLVIALSGNLIWLYIAGIIQGFSLAQFSGTVPTWFDNNYKEISKYYDQEYKIYPILQMRISVFSTFSIVFYSLMGGYVAVIFTRQIGLIIESFLSILSVILIFFLMTDLKYTKKTIKEQKLSFMANFKQGLKFFISGKEKFFLILSFSLIMTEGAIYVGILLIPVYNTYLGSDYYISIIISLNLLVTLVFKLFLLDKIVKNSKNLFNVNKYYITATIFYYMIPLLFIIIPYSNTFNLVGIMILVSITIVADTLGIVSNVLLQRQIIMIVPNNIRNSIYSLRSSLATIMIIIYIPIITTIYQRTSLTIALFVDLTIYLLIILFIVLTTISRERRMEKEISLGDQPEAD